MLKSKEGDGLQGARAHEAILGSLFSCHTASPPTVVSWFSILRSLAVREEGIYSKEKTLLGSGSSCYSPTPCRGLHLIRLCPVGGEWEGATCLVYG